MKTATVTAASNTDRGGIDFLIPASGACPDGGGQPARHGKIAFGRRGPAFGVQSELAGWRRYSVDEHPLWGNSFPGLAWSPAAKGTESLVVVVQDMDESRDGEPSLQLTLYNIPADATRLTVGMVPEGNPRGSSYGPNDTGNARPYSGPNPPPGPEHHYHFQVFALNRLLPSNKAMTYDELLGDMRGHVLASGEIVGLSKAPGSITGTKAALPTDPFIK